MIPFIPQCPVLRPAGLLFMQATRNDPRILPQLSILTQQKPQAQRLQGLRRKWD